jgi:hypothetical protein
MVMSVETIEFRLVGAAPLLMHCGALADPLDERSINLAAVTCKRSKTRADHEEIARLEWYGGLWLHNSLPCHPSEAIEAVFIKAAKTRNRGDAAKAGFAVPAPAMLIHDGPTDLGELWKDEKYRLRKGVRVHGARTMRTRARFPTWSAVVSATFITTVLNRSEIIELFQIAGYLKGIGDWRPRYGKFTVQQK